MAKDEVKEVLKEVAKEKTKQEMKEAMKPKAVATRFVVHMLVALAVFTFIGLLMTLGKC